MEAHEDNAVEVAKRSVEAEIRTMMISCSHYVFKPCNVIVPILGQVMEAGQYRIKQFEARGK